jgi:uncharacterized protein
MRNFATKHPKGPDSRSPLVFDTRDLGPGSVRTLTRTVPAPEYLGVAMARVPVGADLDLDVQLEGVNEGVLVTVTVSGPLAGECARCLEPFTSSTKVRFQELFVRPERLVADAADEADNYELDATGLLDLEPALRDAVVLELPLSPLCQDGCLGLCSECGIRLADAGPGHRHEQRGALWDVLKDFRAEQPDGKPLDEEEVPDGNAPARGQPKEQ